MAIPNVDRKIEFLYYWRALASDAPEPVSEYRFAEHLGRRFRFDFAWPDSTPPVSVEVDGGQWINNASGGYHSHDNDREKLNLATELGWRVYRYSPQMLKAHPGACIAQVLKAIRND